jgi:hypothetical protein
MEVFNGAQDWSRGPQNFSSLNFGNLVINYNQLNVL